MDHWNVELKMGPTIINEFPKETRKNICQDLFNHYHRKANDFFTIKNLQCGSLTDEFGDHCNKWAGATEYTNCILAEG